MRRSLIGLVVVLCAVGCGSSPSGSCDKRATDSTCTDWSGDASLDNVKTQCGSEWHDGSCTHLGAVAGCKHGVNGLTATEWFYPPMYTAALAMQGCNGANSQYVSP
jgi:hypothetical protein